MREVFYLGPASTFTHDAARLYFEGSRGIEFQPCSSPLEVMGRLHSDGQGFGVVPVENSIHGEVIPTLDALCFEVTNIFVVGEVSLPVSFTCFGGIAATPPSIVMSHPHALAQCRHFIASHGLQEQAVSSTAEACRIVAESGDAALAAIASPSAGNRFGLLPIQTEVEDFSGAYTRFLILSNRLTMGGDTDRTMLALVPPTIAEGVIAEFAGSFAQAGVNIFEIHTRPLRTGPGHYLFIMTVSGSPADTSTGQVINHLLASGYCVKLLGAFRAWPSKRAAERCPNLPGLLFDAEGLQRTLSAAVAPAPR